MRQRQRPPNVVLFISDQQRADSMPGARAAPGIRTPHLDWLAERGTLFRRAYCTTPICTPARASLLTGLLPHTSGMVANHQPKPIADELRLPADVRVLADYLKPLGYVCGYSGKWHLGSGGDRRGFNDFVSRSGTFDVDSPDQNESVTFAQRLGLAIEGSYSQNVDRTDFDPKTRLGHTLHPLAFHPSMLDAVHAATFIRQQAGDARPFCLAFSCHEPHPPFIAPRPFGVGMYAPETMPLPATLDDPNGPDLMRRRGDDHLRAASRFSVDELRRMWAGYYGAISYVDHLLGTILAALVDSNALDDTLLIYTSDHGEMLGSHGLWSKGAVFYEELVNVPLLIMPPGGSRPGHEAERLVSQIDLVPTVLAWCGADVPDRLEGVDIRPLIEGGPAPVREAVPLEYHSVVWGGHLSPLRGWRTEEWKYVETLDGTDELYDLRADPAETRNLNDEPAAAAARERLKADLHRWLAATGDRWPEVPLPPNLTDTTGATKRTVGAAE